VEASVAVVPPESTLLESCPEDLAQTVGDFAFIVLYPATTIRAYAPSRRQAGLMKVGSVALSHRSPAQLGRSASAELHGRLTVELAAR
jgi:hypothetical protein